MGLQQVKLSKQSTIQLLKKYEEKSVPDDELLLIREILIKRGAIEDSSEPEEQLPTLTPGKLKAVEDKITEIIESGDKPLCSRLLDLLDGVEEYSLLSEDQVDKILTLSSEDKPKESEKKTSVKPTIKPKVQPSKLSPEVEDILNSERSKKDKILALAKLGLTKQQQEVLGVAHWSYIYELYRTLNL